MNVNHGDLTHVCMSCASGYFSVILVRTRTFDIYVHYDIMQVFPFLSIWRRVMCCVCQARLRGYTYDTAWLVNVRVCVSCVGKYTHSIRPELERVQGHVTILKDRSQSCYVCGCIANPNSEVIY